MDLITINLIGIRSGDQSVEKTDLCRFLGLAPFTRLRPTKATRAGGVEVAESCKRICATGYFYVEK